MTPLRHPISFVGLFTNLSCVSLNASSERLAKRLQNHTGGICLISHHYGFSSDSLNYLPGSMYSHTGCICLIFSTVGFQMCPQIACLRRYIITLVAFVWFSPFCVFLCLLILPMCEDAKLHRFSQIACIFTGIILFYIPPLCIFNCFVKLYA